MKKALDRIDFDLLDALQNDARASNKQLAKTVHLAQSSCHARVRRLQESGVVRAMRAELDPAVIGIGLQAFVFVRLGQHDRESVLAFREHAMALEEAVGLFHVAGRFDFILHLAVRDADHLRDVAMASIEHEADKLMLTKLLQFDEEDIVYRQASPPRASCPSLTCRLSDLFGGSDRPPGPDRSGAEAEGAGTWGQ